MEKNPNQTQNSRQKSERAIALKRMFVSPHFWTRRTRVQVVGLDGVEEEYHGTHSICWKPFFIKIRDNFEVEETEYGVLFSKILKDGVISFVLAPCVADSNFKFFD